MPFGMKDVPQATTNVSGRIRARFSTSIYNAISDAIEREAGPMVLSRVRDVVPGMWWDFGGSIKNLVEENVHGRVNAYLFWRYER